MHVIVVEGKEDKSPAHLFSIIGNVSCRRSSYHVPLFECPLILNVKTSTINLSYASAIQARLILRAIMHVPACHLQGSRPHYIPPM